jgi:hypothetical protein
VVVSAQYAPGEVVDETESKPDTLKILLSESATEIAQGAPFLFVGDDGTGYTMALQPLSHSGKRFTFIVEELSGVEYPGDGDSVWIEPAFGVSDVNGNVQDNEQNKRVAMKVLPKPYKLVAKAAPNPFVPGESRIPVTIEGVTITRGVTIRVDALTSLEDQGMTLDASAVIYDVVGNVMARSDGVEDHQEDIQVAVVHDPLTRLYILWTGRNRLGRYVGAGTYIAYVQTKDSSGETQEWTIRIGVQK